MELVFFTTPKESFKNNLDNYEIGVVGLISIVVEVIFELILSEKNE